MVGIQIFSLFFSKFHAQTISMFRSFLLAFFLIIWSNFSFAQRQPSILITYYSQSGNTKAMAEAIFEGATSVSGVVPKIRPIEEVSTQDLLDANAIIVGSPVYNSNVAPEVLEFMNSWPFEGRPLKNKLGAAFATGGGISIGEEGVMLDILRGMLIHGMIVLGGDQVEASFGASGVTGESPFDSGQLDPLFLEKGRGLGRRVAETAKRFQE